MACGRVGVHNTVEIQKDDAIHFVIVAADMTKRVAGS
jgi:hypothetical protein